MNPHSSDEDNDAPEAVSLSQSKKLIQQQNSSIQQFENAQKQKTRAKNRERDRKLKDQAQGRKKGKGKEAVVDKEDEESSGDDEGDNDAIARMQRAMKEAGEESDEDMDDDAEMHSDEDEEEGEEEEEEEFHGFDAPRNSNHLPDHLFTEAATFVSSVEQKTKPQSPKEAEKTRKRKRSSTNKAKDRVLGSRIIRALPYESNKPPSGTASMVPTAKVRKFLDRNLFLRKTDKRVGGWERRAANIGSMKINNGPAAHFLSLSNCQVSTDSSSAHFSSKLPATAFISS
ncbi:uncharacterized protein BT62DRAFT_363684 [Guyanagaster necrorhizus]|uniref:Uncharacterized protein n=1 Tax=Guyanagaster necrorhizus TaxID=856835 RepID=A0A9P7VLV6_9AGAR|nr:uncharacterized protein BT62DRAFT_363684 [Guyanagaster necrorhizus MCA 3950]KAG7442915.1 hypothetical protein BT62DRAFT_363684 [Guyanagaster necrorhizus MCA 3950]